MSEQGAERQKDIESLLAERKKFEVWLAQLEAKRASASVHVFERVHADYTKRLEDVRGRLHGEADALTQLVTELEVRLGKEQDRVTKKTDERAEAELRALVGEFSEKEWASTSSKLDASIADLRGKFDATERELADLKNLLASVKGAPAPARASVMMAADASVTAALDDAEKEEAAPPVEPEQIKAPEPEQKKATEPEPPKPREAEVPVEAKKPAPKPAPFKPAEPKVAAKAPEPTPEPPPRKSTPFDELAFLRSVAGTPSRPSGNAAIPAMAPPPIVADPEPEPLSPVSEPESSVNEEPSAPRESKATAEPEETGPLGAPTPRTSQAIRSLKCQECGTLNFPTEWYCERCGGELAAF